MVFMLEQSFSLVLRSQFMPGLLGHGQSFKRRDKDDRVCGSRGRVG